MVRFLEVPLSQATERLIGRVVGGEAVLLAYTSSTRRVASSTRGQIKEKWLHVHIDFCPRVRGWTRCRGSGRVEEPKGAGETANLYSFLSLFLFGSPFLWLFFYFSVPLLLFSLFLFFFFSLPTFPSVRTIFLRLVLPFFRLPSYQRCILRFSLPPAARHSPYHPFSSLAPTYSP